VERWKWKRALGLVDVEGNPNGPRGEECKVPGFAPSTPKRIHLDLRPAERTRDEELEVLRGTPT